jgi:hypothetical protein
MVALIEAQTGVGPAKRPRLSETEFWNRFRAATHPGKVAGGLLLSFLQLQQNGIPPTLNRAIAMVKPLLPVWEQPTGSEWHSHDALAHTPTERQRLLHAFNSHLSVSHFWAALILGEQNKSKISLPDSNAALPQFLGYAEAIAGMAEGTLWWGKDRTYLLPRDRRWRIIIPKVLEQNPKLEVLPLEKEQKEYLARFKSLKRL